MWLYDNLRAALQAEHLKESQTLVEAYLPCMTSLWKSLSVSFAHSTSQGSCYKAQAIFKGKGIRLYPFMERSIKEELWSQKDLLAFFEKIRLTQSALWLQNNFTCLSHVKYIHSFPVSSQSRIL